MAEKKLVMLVLGVIGIIGIILILNIPAKSEAINIPSKCYTDLQPSSFFREPLTASPITKNYDKKYIQIDFFNIERDFFIDATPIGNSMLPTISNNSIVIMIKPKEEDIKIGDIISFKCGGIEILHRIINISEGIYITKGDNNHIEDDCQTKIQDIRGQIVGILY